METFTEHLHLPVTLVDDSEKMLAKLKGISDPEAKRKCIGGHFIQARSLRIAGWGRARRRSLGLRCAIGARVGRSLSRPRVAAAAAVAGCRPPGARLALDPIPLPCPPRCLTSMRTSWSGSWASSPSSWCRWVLHPGCVCARRCACGSPPTLCWRLPTPALARTKPAPCLNPNQPTAANQPPPTNRHQPPPQGTLYPDVIESCPPPGSGQKHSHTIKSHHNVGGLPKDLQFKLIEPFRELFKDEVRRRACVF